jgi:hypothetical protein
MMTNLFPPLVTITFTLPRYYAFLSGRFGVVESFSCAFSHWRKAQAQRLVLVGTRGADAASVDHVRIRHGIVACMRVTIVGPCVLPPALRRNRIGVRGVGAVGGAARRRRSRRPVLNALSAIPGGT